MNFVRFSTAVTLDTTTQLANLFFKITHKEDEESKLLSVRAPPLKGERSIYDDAKPMLEVSALIYIFVELRRFAKSQLVKFRDERELEKSDMDVLKDAWYKMKEKLEAIENAPTNGTTNGLDPALAATEYRKAVEELEVLKKKMHLRDGDIEIVGHNLDILSLPKKAGQCKADLMNNAADIKAFIGAFGGTQINFEFVKGITDREQSPSILWDLNDTAESTDFLGFDVDTVYAIVINEDLKRISVVFRGSASIRDWIIDLSFNPSQLLLAGRSCGALHGGFYEYLFERDATVSNSISTSQEIMNKVNEALKIYPDYDVYFTGHSLGGALSTLMAFRAAMDSTMKKPVTNVSFASPFVGDEAFLKSFQDLERKGRLRHLRFSNEDDIVPLMPFMSYNGIAFKQTGMNVRLYNKTFWRPFNYRIFYPKIGGSVIDTVVRVANNNVLSGITLTTPLNHLVPEYHERMEDAKEELQKIGLNALYKDKDIVGPGF